MAKSQEIIDSAHLLYLEVDNAGNPKYSDREIAEIIQQKTNKKINNSTISDWAKKYNWKTERENLNKKAVHKELVKQLKMEEKFQGDVIRRNELIRRAVAQNEPMAGKIYDLTNFLLTLTTAWAYKKTDELKQKTGLTDDEIEARRLSNTMIIRIFEATMRQRMQHIALISKVTPEEEIQEALMGDPNYVSTLESINKKMLEDHPDLEKIFRMIEATRE